MALNETGRKYLRWGGAIVVVVGALEIARRVSQGGPVVSRRTGIGRHLVKEEDVGWAEIKEGMGVSQEKVLALDVGDEIVVVEMVCVDDACTKVDGPIAVVHYEVDSVGPEGILFKKAAKSFPYSNRKSKGPREVAFVGSGYGWVAEVTPHIRQIKAGPRDEPVLGAHCNTHGPAAWAEMEAKGFICDPVSGEYVPDPQHIA